MKVRKELPTLLTKLKIKQMKNRLLVMRVAQVLWVNMQPNLCEFILSKRLPVCFIFLLSCHSAKLNWDKEKAAWRREIDQNKPAAYS